MARPGPSSGGRAGLRRVTAALFGAIWLIVVVRLFAPSDALARAGDVLLVLLIALALGQASRHIRILALALAAGVVSLVALSGNFAALWRGLDTALPFAAFLPTVVALRAAVELSPTVLLIRDRVTALSPEGRSVWMMFGAHLLGAIITLGFVAVLRPMLPQRIDDAERLELARSAIRGLGMAVTWSPFFVASAVASQLVPTVPAWRTIGFGIVLGLIGMAVSMLMFTRALRWPDFMRALLRVRSLLGPTALLVGAVALISWVSGWTSLQSIVVAIPLASGAYILLRAGERRRQVGAQVVSGVGRMGDEVIIMTASAIFGSMLAGYGAPEPVVQAVETLGQFPLVVIAAAVAVIVTLGFVGVHPLVSAMVLVPLAMSLDLPLAPQVLAHVVTLSWSMSSTIAIWTVPVVLTSSMFEVPVRGLSTGANVRFVAVFGLVASVALALLNGVLLG